MVKVSGKIKDIEVVQSSSEDRVVKNPSKVDLYAGKRLREIRRKLGISQQSLASEVGTTFQQIQKYEKGINRITVSKLYQFCKVFHVKPSYFLYDDSYIASEDTSHYSLSEDNSNIRELDDIVELSKKISDPKTLKLVKDLLKSLAK